DAEAAQGRDGAVPQGQCGQGARRGSIHGRLLPCGVGRWTGPDGTADQQYVAGWNRETLATGGALRGGGSECRSWSCLCGASFRRKRERAAYQAQGLWYATKGAGGKKKSKEL